MSVPTRYLRRFYDRPAPEGKTGMDADIEEHKRLQEVWLRLEKVDRELQEIAQREARKGSEKAP